MDVFVRGGVALEHFIVAPDGLSLAADHFLEDSENELGARVFLIPELKRVLVELHQHSLQIQVLLYSLQGRGQFQETVDDQRYDAGLLFDAPELDQQVEQHTIHEHRLAILYHFHDNVVHQTHTVALGTLPLALGTMALGTL